MSSCQPLTPAQLAELAGISQAAISQAAKTEDAPMRVQDGRRIEYPCREAGEWLKRRHLRGIGVTEDGQVFDLDKEKARLTFHQANIAALEEQVKRKNLLPADQVKARWVEMQAAARARLLSIPSQMAGAAYGREPAEIEKLATRLVQEALEELSRGNGVD
jgi:phage terminase Nu1 subunit (DNA packaging protein)